MGFKLGLKAKKENILNPTEYLQRMFSVNLMTLFRLSIILSRGVAWLNGG